jgi:hypothetical protein
MIARQVTQVIPRMPQGGRVMTTGASLQARSPLVEIW